MAAVCKIATANADTVDRANAAPEETLAALRRESLLSLLVPTTLGGQGQSLTQLAATCHALAQACGSSAMIFAMHHIQVACIVAHGQRSDWHRTLLRRICDAAIAAGLRHLRGGNRRQHPRQHVRRRAGRRAGPSGEGRDHHILWRAIRCAADHCPARARCSRLRPGHAGRTTRRLPAGADRRVGCAWHARHLQRRVSRFISRRTSSRSCPAPFADIASRTMLPVSHLLWSSVWLGIAADAVARARAYLRQQGRGGRPRCRRAAIDWREQRRCCS